MKINLDAGSFSIIGESPQIREVLDIVARVASSQSTVMIYGESGTGKELFAHLVHDRSQRQNKPFVSVSCGALPASILERELFGNEKGAFTGADTQKIGLFEAADTGTLFLDEIGEMPLDMQVKLLRIIQEESFIRLGGTETIKVDVRLITATNLNLDKEVQEGNFRFSERAARCTIEPPTLPVYVPAPSPTPSSPARRTGKCLATPGFSCFIFPFCVMNKSSSGCPSVDVIK